MADYCFINQSDTAANGYWQGRPWKSALVSILVGVVVNVVINIVAKVFVHMPPLK